MVAISFVLTVVSFLAFLGFAIRRKSEKAGLEGRKWLPGPMSLPFLGSVLQIGWLSLKFPEKNFRVFEEFCNRHGPVIGVQAGSQYMVVVEDYATAKSILFSEAWTDRFPAHNKILKLNTGEKNFGIMFPGGEMWKENRKFILTKLKESGFSDKNIMEASLSEELDYFFKTFDGLRASNNNQVAMHSVFKLATLNTVWRALCGARLTEHDPRVAAFIEQVEVVNTSVKMGAQPEFAFPFIYGIPGATNFRVLKDHQDTLEAFFREIMNKRRADGSYLHSETNLMDSYLKKIDEVRDTPASQFYCDEQLLQTCVDNFNAGADTTGATLEFAVLYMLAFPEVQRKVQAEIDRVIVENGSPVITISDKKKMPYTEAVILETLRFGGVIPVIPRSNGADTTLNGCFVPKGSVLLINSYKLNHDKEVWGDPDLFRPERFLDEDGQIVMDSILAFGAGKRYCTGVTTAKAALFKIFAAVLQRYTLEPSPTHPLGPITDFDTGINNKPKPFHCIAKLRRQVEI